MASWDNVISRLSNLTQLAFAGGAAERKQALAEGVASSSSAPSAESSSSNVACNDRLLQLLIKGILYESCVDYCQAKATGAKTDSRIEFTRLLSKSELGDSDLSLLSWLQVCRLQNNPKYFQECTTLLHSYRTARCIGWLISRFVFRVFPRTRSLARSSSAA